MKRLYYLLWHLYLVLDFFVVAYLGQILHRDPIKRRQYFIRNTTRIGSRFIKAFNITLKVVNQEKLREFHNTPYLLVSNHLSYTDIILLSSLENLVFITSVEMGNNPFLGAITRFGGCLYTDRKKPVSLKTEIQKFSDTITEGFKVVLFAEGTSTNGDTVKDFRSSLFQVSILAKCPIVPLCIKYKAIDNEPFSPKNRDLICWYGDMDFAPHFMKLLGRKIEVEISVLDPVYGFDSKTRAELSEGVLTQIRSCYHKA